MKKIKDNLLLAAGCLSFVVSLVLYIKSYAKWDDGWGVDYSFNETYIVAMVVGLALVVFAAYNLFAKNPSKNASSYYALTTTGVIGFYFLGVFAKAMAKGKPFADNQNALWIGLFVTILFAYFVVNYLQNKKEQ